MYCTSTIHNEIPSQNQTSHIIHTSIDGIIAITQSHRSGYPLAIPASIRYTNTTANRHHKSFAREDTRTMTELMWEGKYKDGKKVGPVRIALPFQTVETVNETAQ